MISVIVCSRDIVLFSRLHESITKTIGVPFQLIKINNENCEFSIAEAYNIGSLKAKFDFLVFVHEDVVFHTNNWGDNLLNHFKKLKNPGLLGVAGNSYHPLAPSDWWVPFAKNRHFNFISNQKNGTIGDGILNSSQDYIPRKVFCIDGVFMAINAKTFSKFRFEEKLQGFHGYDTSLSLRVSKEFTNYFIPDLLLEHFSSGNYTREFWKNTVVANLYYSKSCRKRNIFNLNYKIEFYSFKKFLLNSIRYRLEFTLFFKMFKYILFKIKVV